MKIETKQPEPQKPNVVIALTHEEAERLHRLLPKYDSYGALYELYAGLDSVLYPIPF